MGTIYWSSFKENALYKNSSGELLLVTTDHIEHGSSNGPLFTGISRIISTDKLESRYDSLKVLSTSFMYTATYGLFFASVAILMIGVTLLFEKMYMESFFLGVMFAVAIFVNKFLSDKAYEFYSGKITDLGWVKAENDDQIDEVKLRKIQDMIEQSEVTIKHESFRPTKTKFSIKQTLLIVSIILLVFFFLLLLAILP